MEEQIFEEIKNFFNENNRLDWSRRDVRNHIQNKLYKGKYEQWYDLGHPLFESIFDQMVKSHMLIKTRYMDTTHDKIKLYTLVKQ